ncbi:hypothetical protein [Streptosporangium lutulentum]|uniref:DUF4388 domain-containing protein n=1 Tax=Streptosporangium lutulentum TaxID=1461250 RepID=A0ABT9QU02_9ACTN|nr:hypothetical protein [Streptosporangium lutulentum]MDP9849890.1 hypothetical protein [Streptosporangium lutulentum]
MQSVENILRGLADDRATGSLRLGKSGTFYLTDGRVTYAESTAAPRVEDLLTAGRRISAHAVRQARQAATEDRWGGEQLVDKGVLTRGELEFCVLNAVLDAAYFLRDATGHRPRFRQGERHWLGPQWYFEVTGLLRECERRRARLDETWPSAELDSLPVVPLGRITAQRVVLTPLQWEVLVGADSATPPAELAHRLGRPAYSVLLAVRQLASSGLLRVPEPKPGVVPAAPAGPVGPAVPAASGPGAAPDPPDPPTTTPQPPDTTGLLPRRTRGGTQIPGAGAAASSESSDWLPAATGDPTDLNLLIRLRNALEALT